MLPKQLLLILLLVVSSVGCFAIELPLQLLWESNNTSSYTPSQTGKELNWNEYYQIGIKLDTLSYKAMEANLYLKNRADFTTNNVEIERISIGYRGDGWAVSAFSKPLGYGVLHQLESNYLVSAGRDDFRYQNVRFNALRLEKGTLGLAVGGNAHNRAMAGVDWQAINSPMLTLKLSEDIRMQDSHWRSPVVISSVQIALRHDRVKLNTQFAASWFMAHNNTPQHSTLYALAEAQLKLSESCELNLSGELCEIEPLQELRQLYSASLTRKLGMLHITPALGFSRFVDSKHGTGSMSLNWHFLFGQRIGLVYAAEGEGWDTLSHSLGLQASLAYGL